MDADYFLKERTKFIRGYFDTATKAFRDVQHDIEEGLPPFDDPPYSEDGEPAFLDEWLEAQTAIEVTGLAYVSMLSDALKLYFKTLQERVIGFELINGEKAFRKEGFVGVYKQVLGEILETDWSECAVRFDIIEQVVLARNRAQHDTDLLMLKPRHDLNTLRKHPRPFFASEEEVQTWEADGTAGRTSYLLAPTLIIERESLFAAIAEIEALAEWMKSRDRKVLDWRRKARAHGPPSR